MGSLSQAGRIRSKNYTPASGGGGTGGGGLTVTDVNALILAAPGVKQVVVAESRTVETIALASNQKNFIPAGMELTVTPKVVGSKFKISCRFFGEADNSWEVLLNVLRNDRRVSTVSGKEGGTFGLQNLAPNGSGFSATPETASFTTYSEIPSPDTTTPITFKFSISNSRASVTNIVVNRTSTTAPWGAYGTTMMIIEEIVG